MLISIQISLLFFIFNLSIIWWLNIIPCSSNADTEKIKVLQKLFYLCPIFVPLFLSLICQCPMTFGMGLGYKIDGNINYEYENDFKPLLKYFMKKRFTVLFIFHIFVIFRRPFFANKYPSLSFFFLFFFLFFFFYYRHREMHICKYLIYRFLLDILWLYLYFQPTFIFMKP